jgi:DNA polymerase family A
MIESFSLDTQCAVDRYATVHVVRDLADVATFYHEWLRPRAGRWLGLDAETNAVDPFHRGYMLRAVQCADDREAWVFDAQRLGPHAVKAIVRGHTSWVAHYSENDLRFIERGAPGSIALESDVPHLWDAQVALAYYDPRTVVTEAEKDGIDPRIRHDKGLKPTFTREMSPAMAQVEAEFDQWAKEHAPRGFKQGDKLKSWKFGAVPFDERIYQTYSAFDPLGTVRLWHKMMAEINHRGQTPVVMGDLTLQWDIDRMTFRGLPGDDPYTRWLDRQLLNLVHRHMPLLNHYSIPPSGMGPSIGAAFTAFGLTSPKISKKTKLPSWDKEVLAEIAEMPGPAGDLARSLRVVRQATKFHSTYVQPILTALDEGDGHVHCSFRAIGTTTGRNSASRPPLQQIPKRKSTAIRAAFGSRPGWVFVSCDMKTGEPRTLASWSGDPHLIEDIYAGDINSALAATAFPDTYNPAEGKSPGTASFGMRNDSKIGFLAMLYGASASKVDKSVGLPPGSGTADKFRRRYAVAFAKGAQLNEQPWVILDSGRVCRLWDRYTVDGQDNLRMFPKPSRLAINYKTQGTQRDILVRAWFRMRERGWSRYLVLFIHDEIILLVPEHLAEKARYDLDECMRMDLDNGMVMIGDATIDGPTWAPQPAAFSDDSIDFEMST